MHDYTSTPPGLLDPHSSGQGVLQSLRQALLQGLHDQVALDRSAPRLLTHGSRSMPGHHLLHPAHTESFVFLRSLSTLVCGQPETNAFYL